MKIPFDVENRKAYYRLLDEMFDSNFWSDGSLTRRFEASFGEYTHIPNTVALSSGGMAILGLLEYLDVRGSEVIVPTNTFMATPLAIKRAGGKVVFADCSRKDLCITLAEVKRLTNKNTKAVIVVHIGGHIAFEIEGIAAYCEEKGIALIEDCAHAHGATYLGKSAGSWGLGGAYSFYATKTMPTGEGGMVVTRNKEVADWLKLWRNYGKKVEIREGENIITYPQDSGFNARMAETIAALGIIQLERMPEVMAWKRELANKYNQIFERRVRFPEGMESGFYKYVVFDYELKEKTGPVFGELCHWFLKNGKKYPDSEWIVARHSCPPIYYGWDHADKSVSELALLLGVDT